MHKTLRGTLAVLAALMLAAPAHAQQHVVVYTAHEASITEQLVPRFEKETGIKVDLIKGGGGDLINRMKAEAASPRADVIWSVGADLLAGNPSLLQPYKPAGLDAVLDPKFASKGDWLPYIVVTYELTKEGGKTQKGDLMPMVASDGPHYGDNVKLQGPGKYKMKVTVAPPTANPHAMLGRHVDKETGVGPWFQPVTVDYEFVYAGTGKKGAY